MTNWDEAKCENCRFFHHGDGECRRHAPHATIAFLYGVALATTRKDEEGLAYVEGGFIKGKPLDGRVYKDAIWPAVNLDDFCGEFEEGDCGMKLPRYGQLRNR